MTITGLSDDDDLLAAEVALGLAVWQDVGSAVAAQPAFAERVAWWEDRFAGLSVPDAGEPGAEVWARIAARLPQNDNSESARTWKLVSAALAAVAAVALVFAVQRPPKIEPAVPRAPAVAALSGDGGSAVSVSYEAATQRLTVAPIRLEPGRGNAELWVIPEGSSVPVSLGVIDVRQPATHRLAAERARLVIAGATLAVSLEPAGGSPTGAPTGPVIASGKLIET